MIGALLAIGIFILQVHFGLIPASQTHRAWETILWPYVLLVIVLCLISSIRAPVAIDRERIASANSMVVEISDLQGVIVKEKEHVRSLINEVDDLKKPKRTPFQEQEYQIIKGVVDGYDENHRAVLRHLLRHGKMTEHHSMGISPLPAGFRRENVGAVLNKLIADNLITWEIHQIGGGWQKTFCVAPGALPFLQELL